MTSGCTFDDYINFKIGDKFKINPEELNGLRVRSSLINFDIDRIITIKNILMESQMVTITFNNNPNEWNTSFENFRKYFIPIESSNNYENNLKPIKYIPLNQNN